MALHSSVSYMIYIIYSDRNVNIIFVCLHVQIVSDEKTQIFNDQLVISYTFKEEILIYYENKHAFILYLYFLYYLLLIFI